MKFGKRGLRLAGMLMGAMMLGSVFAGCGGGGGDAKKSAEIKVGANFEITGGVANYGKATYEGLQLAIDEINAAGGINGKKFKVIKADSKSETSEAANAATKLISDEKVKVTRPGYAKQFYDFISESTGNRYQER